MKLQDLFETKSPIDNTGDLDNSDQTHVTDDQIEQILNGRYESYGLKLPTQYTLWRGSSSESGRGMATYGTG